MIARLVRPLTWLTAALAIGSTGLAGCAGRTPPAPEAAQAAPAMAGPSRAQALAAAFVRAEAAHARGDKVALARALTTIERSGAMPLSDPDARDPLPAWRAALPRDLRPMRGSPLGAGYRTGVIGSRGKASFGRVFLSGKTASIALSTPGEAPVSLVVLDGKARPVCKADASNSACRWVPLFTQRYTIELHNAGDRSADYFLVIE